MYSIKFVNKAGKVVEDFTGAISMRLSEAGLCQAGYYDGSETVYKMCEGDTLTKAHLSEEEIMAIPGLAEFWVASKEAAEVQAETPEVEAPTVH